jgi:lysozyme family protein
MSTFEQAVEIVLHYEGGYSVDPDDPGNWTGGRVGEGALRGTKFGISAAAYPDEDIAALSRERAGALYRRDYWETIAGDALPPPLALLVFDAAVNNGTHRAAMWLQQAVGAVDDGHIGSKTLAATATSVSARGIGAVCADFQALRLVFMVALPNWRHFASGWARRLCLLPYQAARFGDQGE